MQLQPNLNAFTSQTYCPGESGSAGGLSWTAPSMGKAEADGVDTVSVL